MTFNEASSQGSTLARSANLLTKASRAALPAASPHLPGHQSHCHLLLGAGISLLVSSLFRSWPRCSPGARMTFVKHATSLVPLRLRARVCAMAWSPSSLPLMAVPSAPATPPPLEYALTGAWNAPSPDTALTQPHIAFGSLLKGNLLRGGFQDVFSKIEPRLPDPSPSVPLPYFTVIFLDS